MMISFCGVRRELSERRKKGWWERRFRSQICSISMKSGVSESPSAAAESEGNLLQETELLITPQRYLKLFATMSLALLEVNVDASAPLHTPSKSLLTITLDSSVCSSFTLDDLFSDYARWCNKPADNFAAKIKNSSSEGVFIAEGVNEDEVDSILEKLKKQSWCKFANCANAHGSVRCLYFSKYFSELQIKEVGRKREEKRKEKRGLDAVYGGEENDDVLIVMSPETTHSDNCGGQDNFSSSDEPPPFRPPPTRRRSSLNLGSSDTPSAREIFAAVSSKSSVSEKSGDPEDDVIRFDDGTTESMVDDQGDGTSDDFHRGSESNINNDADSNINNEIINSGEMTKEEREREFFRAKQNDTAKKKKELEQKLAVMGTEEREKYDREEKAKSLHQDKQAMHLKRLGAGLKARKSLMPGEAAGGRGRGGRGGRGGRAGRAKRQTMML